MKKYEAPKIQVISHNALDIIYTSDFIHFPVLPIGLSGNTSDDPEEQDA